MPRRLVLTLALALVLAAPARAQSVWLDREPRPSVLAEVYFPSFDGADSHFPTWTWFAATRLPIGRTTSFVAELPYVRWEFGSGLTNSSDASIGNPYLGVEIAPHPTGPRFEIGARVPLMSDDNLTSFLVGYLTDVERQEAFVPHVVAMRLGMHYHHAADEGSRVAYDLRLVPSAWITTDDSFLADNEVFIGYGGTVRYEGEHVRAGGGFTGRWNATNGGGDFGASSFHQLDLAADFLRGPVRPGIQLKVPLDADLTSFIDTTVGVSLTILP